MDNFDLLFILAILDHSDIFVILNIFAILDVYDLSAILDICVFFVDMWLK